MNIVKKKHPQDININWYGPFTVGEVKKRFNNKGFDCGVYQIYGSHPIYGSNVLLYVGKTQEQTFGKRITQHESNWLKNNPDSNNIEVYIGRLAAADYGSFIVTLYLIDLAERLIILSCTPARNGMSVTGFKGEDISHIHLFNWGNYRSILPEISGRRWVTKFTAPDFDGTSY
ncbi:hypothetical protein ABE033_10365 [Priestia megaterium]